jgi:hypothetical protein
MGNKIYDEEKKLEPHKEALKLWNNAEKRDN